MNKAKEGFGASAGRVAADTSAKTVGRELRAQTLEFHKERLYECVETAANRPPRDNYRNIVASIACRGLQRDYNRMCKGINGGFLIVYDREGTGKSCSLQGVARAKSDTQPRRFLVINQ